jgi:predicted nucleic acid-binding protein
MIVIDASVWVSRILLDDQFHAVSRAWLRAQAARGHLLVVPSLFFAEVGGAVSRRSGSEALGVDAIQRIARVPALRVMALNRELGMQAGRLAALLRLRGADAVYVALARRLNVPLATWDDELFQRGGQAVAMQRPE